MTALLTAIEAMTDQQRQGAMVALDHMTRPLDVREIEKALRAHGVPRSRAVITAASLKTLAIIAVLGPEAGS